MLQYFILVLGVIGMGCAVIGEYRLGMFAFALIHLIRSAEALEQKRYFDAKKQKAS